LSISSIAVCEHSTALGDAIHCGSEGCSLSLVNVPQAHRDSLVIYQGRCSGSGHSKGRVDLPRVSAAQLSTWSGSDLNEQTELTAGSINQRLYSVCTRPESM
jgi:hypothetical protein